MERTNRVLLLSYIQRAIDGSSVGLKKEQAEQSSVPTTAIHYAVSKRVADESTIDAIATYMCVRP